MLESAKTSINEDLAGGVNFQYTSESCEIPKHDSHINIVYILILYQLKLIIRINNKTITLKKNPKQSLLKKKKKHSM